MVLVFVVVVLVPDGPGEFTGEFKLMKELSGLLTAVDREGLAFYFSSESILWW